MQRLRRQQNSRHQLRSLPGSRHRPRWKRNSGPSGWSGSAAASPWRSAGYFSFRYTIEQGLLGPGVRVVLGAIFSALLITAGEWARRNEIADGITAIPTRHIP